MRRILYERVTEYSAATGCACEIEEGSCRATLSVEGLMVHIGLLEEVGMLLFQTGVAYLPPRGEGREELCVKLLAANNLFSNTMGFTFGVDELQEAVTIQLAWDALHLDSEAFSHIVNNLFSVTVDWMTRLDDWRPTLPEEGSTSDAADSFMMNFLKV